jgi:hypothetical protein
VQYYILTFRVFYDIILSEGEERTPKNRTTTVRGRVTPKKILSKIFQKGIDKSKDL